MSQTNIFYTLNYNTMDPIVHFELPSEDKKRMVDFYTKAFGWKTQQLGPEMGDYVLVTTTEVDEKTGFPKQPGSINGGFFQKSETSGKNARITVAVDDINESIKKVKEAGGKVDAEPVMIPNVGMYVTFTDTEGNQLSIMQPVQNSPMNVKEMMDK